MPTYRPKVVLFVICQNAGGRYITLRHKAGQKVRHHSTVGTVRCTPKPYRDEVEVKITAPVSNSTAEDERLNDKVIQAMKRRFPGKKLVPPTESA